jgi:hypothetical protein
MTQEQNVMRCLVCGCLLIGARHGTLTCLSKKYRAAQKKQQLDARRRDVPGYREQQNAKHNAFKKKPDYIAKAKAARAKRESDPAKRKKLNAYQVEYHHKRMLDPAYHDAVNAGARRRYHKDPVKKADRIAKTVARRRDNPEAKRKAREADARCRAKKRAANPLDPQKRSQAVEFLRKALASGPQPVKLIKQQAKACGISGGRTLWWQACKALGVIAKKAGFGSQGVWTWRLPARPKEAKQKRGTRSEAIEFLRKALASGPQPAELIEQQAEASGISERTLGRARQDLGVIAEKDGYQGAWTSRLP